MLKTEYFMKGILILTALCLLSFCSISQETLPHFTPKTFETFRFAHRGGNADGPENTLSTIINSINSGVNAIEIDIELTLDNELVVFHDKKIGRILASKTNYEVSDLTLYQLKNIPLRDTSNGIQYVCSLNELIDTLTILIPNAQIRDFILELDFKPHGNKTSAAVNALNQIIKNHEDIIGNGLYNYFFVSSFYPGVLKELKHTNPNIITSFALHNAPESNKLPAKMAILFAHFIVKKSEVKIIEPNLCMISDRFVSKWKKRDILIVTYTANTKCEKNYLEKYPIAYTTDCPQRTCISEKYGKPKAWCKQCQ